MDFQRYVMCYSKQFIPNSQLKNKNNMFCNMNIQKK